MRDVTNNLMLWSILGIVLLATHVLAGDKDGNNSPEECRTDYKLEDPGDKADLFAGQGFEITYVCIKSGSNMFNGGHSVGLLNGVWEDGCYQLRGVGTSLVTATRLKDGPNCQAISHLDYQIEAEPGDSGDDDDDCGADACDDPPVVTPPETHVAHAIPAMGPIGIGILVLVVALWGGYTLWRRG